MAAFGGGWMGGSSTFGTPTTSAAPSFGFAGFGTSSAAPTFGSSTAPTFGTSTAPLFGTTATSAFGTPTGLATTFGTGGFGTTTTGTLGTSGFGTTTTGTFGTSSTGPAGTGLFGSGTGTLGAGTGAFGLGTGNFGSAPTGFGLGTSTAFGSTAANQQVYTSDNLAALATALSLPTVYGDERDTLLAKWNQLQAFWGSGKGYYAPNAAPVTFAPDNIFCRFKAIGFSRIPEGRNEEGLCMLIINKKDTEVIQQQQQLVDSLYRLLGSKPTLSVCVEGVKPIPDNKCEVVMYVLERAATGASRRVPAMDLFSFLNTVRTQLVGMGIDTVIPKLAPTKEQLAEYLKNPPAGIDPLIWQQAKLDNPNPGLLIPVPMIGFTELYRRLKFQEQETKLHQGRLDMIAQDIAELQRNHSTTQAKVQQYRRKLLELSHRLLKVMIRQEVARKQGYAIQVDEEQLRDQLEAIQNELNAPTQFKGRLNELMSQIRMQNEMSGMRWEDKYSIDEHLLQEIKQHLKKQHDGISHLISVIKDDMEDLSIIQQGLQITQPSYRR